VASVAFLLPIAASGKVIIAVSVVAAIALIVIVLRIEG
jgi:hypothetical protein